MGWDVRCVALLLAALSLSASQPPQRPAQAQQKQADSQLQASTTRIVDAINNVAAEKDAGCEDRKDKRSSDLCAQWKAADAARDAADYTLIAVFLSFVGTLLVAATFWEQRKTSREELRAYVLLKGADVSEIDRDGKANASIVLANTGITPAFDVVFWGVTSVSSMPPRDDWPPKKPDWLKVSAETLAKDRETTLVLPVGPVSKNMLERLRVGSAGIYFFGEARYRDAFGKMHTTHLNLVSEGEGFHRRAFHACETGNRAD